MSLRSLPVRQNSPGPCPNEGWPGVPDKTLPRRQEALLRLIVRHQKHGMVPAAAVLAEEMGLAGESSVTPALRALEAKGYLRVEGGVRGRQRFIRVTPKASAYLMEGLPVIGSIPAGDVGEACRGANRLIERLEDLLPWSPGDFMLEVEGDSMIGMGIHPGDLILLRPGESPRPGEVAAVLIEDSRAGTLKRVYLDPDSDMVRLQAAHPACPDQELPSSSIRIAGVMRGLVRPHHEG